MVPERRQCVIGFPGASSVRGDLPDLLDHQVFNFQGGKIPGRTGLAASLERVDASVELVAFATILAGKGRRHGKATGSAVQDAFEPQGQLGRIREILGPEKNLPESEKFQLELPGF